MTLIQLHHFFDRNGVYFHEVDTNGYAHCIYRDSGNGRKFTIPKIENGHIKLDLIHLACAHFQIPYPNSN